MGRKGRKGSIWLGSPNWKREEEKKEKERGKCYHGRQKGVRKMYPGIHFCIIFSFLHDIGRNKMHVSKKGNCAQLPFFSVFYW